MIINGVGGGTPGVGVLRIVVGLEEVSQGRTGTVGGRGDRWKVPIVLRERFHVWITTVVGDTSGVGWY